MSVSKGVALVTGAAQGIGRGIALRLASDGFNIAINDVPKKSAELKNLAVEIENLNSQVCIIPADVSVDEPVREMVDSAVSKLGGLDVMVANAGIIGEVSSFVSSTVESFDHVLSMNTRGAFLCYKYAALQMIKQGRGGRIIGASSLAGKIGHPCVCAYTTSKFAIRGLTQVAALELGKYGITVNSYAPGGINTPMVKDTLAQFVAKESIIDPDILKWLESMNEKLAIKRLGQPEEIASIVSYLASKEAHFITGQCISVDGGASMS